MIAQTPALAQRRTDFLERRQQLRGSAALFLSAAPTCTSSRAIQKSCAGRASLRKTTVTTATADFADLDATSHGPKSHPHARSCRHPC